MTTISRHLHAETPDVVFPRRDPRFPMITPPWPDEFPGDSDDEVDTDDNSEDDDDES